MKISDTIISSVRRLKGGDLSITFRAKQEDVELAERLVLESYQDDGELLEIEIKQFQNQSIGGAAITENDFNAQE